MSVARMRDAEREFRANLKNRPGIGAECDALAVMKKRPEGISPSGLDARGATVSELESQSELDLTRASRCRDGPNLHEVRIREAGHRIPPTHMVQDVGRLHPELDTIAANRESPENTHVEIPVHW